MTNVIQGQKAMADGTAALLDQAGMAAYERDPLAQTFLLWLTRADRFTGGVLPQAGGITATVNYRDNIHPDDADRFAAALVQALANEGTYDIDYRLQMADGRYVWVRDAGRIESATTGMPLRARGVLQFVEHYIVRAEAAEFSSRHDAQTGRPNRAAFEQMIADNIAAGVRGAVLAVSIDNLTFLNEAIGPSAVNDVLRAAAQRLDHLLPSATIARVGGDSFAIWLQDHNEEAVRQAAQQVLQAFRDEQFVTQECAVNVSVSAGAVTVPDLAMTSVDALTRAEQALKHGRAAGRSSYRFYEASEDRRTQNLASLGEIDRFRKAFTAGDAVLAFQPIVSAFDGRIAFHEALLRIREPDGTYISAWKLIQAFEQHGLAEEVDRHVVGLALAALRAAPDLKLSVNLSAATVSSHLFQEYLAGLLDNQQDIASRLIWEITETAAVNDLSDARRFVELMHARGAKVALDDYGEGYTSLQHLRHLEVDKIKIDGSLIKGIVDNAKNQVMVKAILAMAQNMGVETVAEFVETDREAAWLQRHGVNFLQGYFFGAAQVGLPSPKSADEKASAFLSQAGMLTLAV